MVSEKGDLSSKKRLYPSDMGSGQYLAAARSWLQSNLPNGDRVTWGSGDLLTMSERQFEDAAAHIAAAAINEDRQKRGHETTASHEPPIDLCGHYDTVAQRTFYGGICPMCEVERLRALHSENSPSSTRLIGKPDSGGLAVPQAENSLLEEVDVLHFLGWLSVEIVELNTIETSRLANAWAKFKAIRYGQEKSAPPVPCRGCGEHHGPPECGQKA